MLNMKKNKEEIDNDYINEENEKLLLSIGYKGVLPVGCKDTAIWMEKHFPESILKKGWNLWRDDFMREAMIKYPFLEYEVSFGLRGSLKDYPDRFHSRRNYIIKLAITELVSKSAGKPKATKKNVGSTTTELKFEVPNEKFDEFATHLSAIKKLLEK